VENISEESFTRLFKHQDRQDCCKLFFCAFNCLPPMFTSNIFIFLDTKCAPSRSPVWSRVPEKFSFAPVKLLSVHQKFKTRKHIFWRGHEMEWRRSERNIQNFYLSYVRWWRCGIHKLVSGSGEGNKSSSTSSVILKKLAKLHERGRWYRDVLHEKRTALSHWHHSKCCFMFTFCILTPLWTR